MLARQIAVGFGIAVIFPLLVYYGVATFYPAPKRQAIVAAVMMPPNPTPEERQTFSEKQREREHKQQEQDEAFKNAAKDFARHLVIFSTPLGVAAILIGAYIPLHAIGTGLIFGGIFTVAWGYWSYWFYLDDWVRFVSLLAGFLTLLFVGHRRIVGTGTRTSAS